MGAVDVTRALIPVTVVTMFIVGAQLSIFSTWRFAGVVFMLVWLWPFALGLAGFTTLSCGPRSWAVSSSTRTPRRPSV